MSERPAKKTPRKVGGKATESVTPAGTPSRALSRRRPARAAAPSEAAAGALGLEIGSLIEAARQQVAHAANAALTTL